MCPMAMVGLIHLIVDGVAILGIFFMWLYAKGMSM